MSVSLTRELHFRGSGPPKFIQKASQNALKKQSFFKRENTWKKLVKKVPKWPPNRTKKRPETTMKKRPKNRRKKGSPETCLSKGTGSALIFQVLHVSSERLPHRPKTSIAPLARSLRSAWDSQSFPISSVQIPKRSPLIPWKFRTKSSWIPFPINSHAFSNNSHGFPNVNRSVRELAALARSLRSPRDSQPNSPVTHHKFPASSSLIHRVFPANSLLIPPDTHTHYFHNNSSRIHD